MNKFKKFKNKKVLVTGHNGFKGTWLCACLSLFGAKVIGVSLKNNNPNSHYNLIKKKLNIKDYFFDIRYRLKLEKVVLSEKPDYIFHLAAQPLVYNSVLKPIFNWETNVIGLLNLLHSIEKLKSRCTAIIITSDKCYKNLEQTKGYKEDDTLGGIDPYSASKASAEILFYSFYKTYIENKKNNIRICSARAGNVIGGGDWSDFRLIPDCMKMWLKNESPIIRNPKSTRPWQHVLEAINGYLVLSLKVNENKHLSGNSFNFSSNKIKNLTVLEFLNEIKKNWPEINWKILKRKKFYESSLLQLNNSKAKNLLNWQSKLNFQETVSYLVEWYKEYKKNRKEIFKTTEKQITSFIDKI